MRNTEGCTEAVIYKLVHTFDIDPSLSGSAYADRDHLDPVGRLRVLVSHGDLQPFPMIKLPSEVRCAI